MIKFSNLQEILNKEQKKEIDNWEKGDNSFSNHLFDHPDHTEKTLSLEHPNETGHIEDIKSHLEPHGINIKDYKSGIGEDKHGREVKLGKALEKTKASDELKNKFANDPSRSNKEHFSSDLRVTISRHPHHVAGMTSSGQSWEKESCMNFETGCNKDYLKQDVKHGTHVAYLHHKDDKDLEHPLARIALKKYTDDEGHSILRPEHKTYGPENSAFHHTVHKFVNDKMPAHATGLYRKNENVYNDDGFTHEIGKGKSALNKVLSATKNRYVPSQEAKAIINHPHFSDEINDKLLKQKKLYGLESPNLSKEYIGKYIDRMIKGEYDGDPLIYNRSLAPEHIHKLIDAGNKTVLHNAEHMPALKAEHIDKLLNNDPHYVSDILRHPSATTEHIHKFIDMHPNKASSVIRYNKKLRENQLHSLAKSVVSGHPGGIPMANAIAYHPNVGAKTISHLLTHPEIKEALGKSSITNFSSHNPDVIKTMWNHQKSFYKDDPKALHFTKLSYHSKTGTPDDVKKELISND